MSARACSVNQECVFNLKDSEIYYYPTVWTMEKMATNQSLFTCT